MSDVLDIMAKTVDRSRILRTSTSEQMQAAIKALDAAGYQIVPKEPTEALINTILNFLNEINGESNDDQLARDCYQLVLEAAKEEQNDG